jgi:hypothetical protein
MSCVTFIEIVAVFITGTLPKSRLKRRIDFSASRTA